MSTRANQQETKAAATKRTASSTKGARGDNNKNVVISDETPRRRASDQQGQETSVGRRASDRRIAEVPASMPQAAEDAAKGAKRGGNGKPKRGQGIGDFVTALLEKNKSTDEILKAVGRKFPEAQTTRASVAWYRSRLSKAGKA